MRKLIKVYGERNTNTNYISELIKLNLKATELPGVAPPFIMKMQNILPGNELVRDIYFDLTYSKNLGWKHTCVKTYEKLQNYAIINSDLAFLTITKNPYSWLLSLYRKPYHQKSYEKSSFENFLRCQWRTIGRDNTDAILESPVELWNIKNRSYLTLGKENVLNITTESIFQDPEDVIRRISHQFAIERTSEVFLNYEPSAKSTKDASKDNSYYRNYYLSEKWRSDLSSEAIAIVNESVDARLMSHFGYRYLS